MKNSDKILVLVCWIILILVTVAGVVYGLWREMKLISFLTGG